MTTFGAAAADARVFVLRAGANEPVYAPYVEHVPPYVTAGIFWPRTAMGMSRDV
jgi:hypothetical protein